LAFVFNKTLMGGGGLAEGRRQWVVARKRAYRRIAGIARHRRHRKTNTEEIGDRVIARDRVIGKQEVLTTKGTHSTRMLAQGRLRNTKGRRRFAQMSAD